MGGISGGGLTCTATTKQALEHGQRLIVGNQLLYTHCHDVELGHGGCHVGIALVGAYHTVACGCHTKVAACHSGSCLHKLVAEMMTGAAGQVCRVVVACFLGDAFLLKHSSHFLTLQVDGGHHDVAGLLVQQLYDALSQVGFHHINAMLFEVRIHLALLGKHRLRLHHLFHVVILEDTEHYLVELLCILCPVHLDTTALQILGEHIEVIGQMGDGMFLDF